MSNLYSYLFALLVISNSTFAQGQPGEEGPPYYGLELPPYGSGREAFEIFEKEVEQRKRAQPGYVPPPYENALEVIEHGPSFHEGVVLSYDEQSIEELKELALDFENPKYRLKRKSAIHALGVIHSVDPQAVSFEYLKAYTVGIEKSQHDQVDALTRAYMAISYSSNANAYDFLAQRATVEFWGNDMPTSDIVSAHPTADDKPSLISAQTEAIRQLSALNDPRLGAFLDQLASETPAEQEEVHWAIESARDSWKSRDKLRALREAAYEKRLKALGLTEEVSAPAAEIPAIAPDEAITTQPEPAIEEPIEVVTVEPSGEPVEQSSQWWLWLVGAVIVIGGVVLLRSKK